MIIIGGIARGQKIFAPKNIRPTRGMVREALFSIIQVADKSFIDLFAGSGAVGVEALSRGASQVVMVEKSRKSVEYINKNLQKTGLNAVVINSSVESSLNTLNIAADFVFMDPPYKTGLIEKTLRKIDNILTKESIIIIEYPTNDKPSYNGFEEIKNKKYGDSSLLFLKK
ncbi:16S rRNA (guanine(966)-N(2))-methyltransferase RsmD [candidate division WOR-3 bacterium]|nr:16S rRNA (guanine(966)-N(2))-methyltransferase RsmD [candidate division WOR-3 bacterium]